MAPLFTAVPIELISMALGIDEVTNYLGYGVAEVKNVQIAPGVLIFISASARGRPKCPSQSWRQNSSNDSSFQAGCHPQAKLLTLVNKLIPVVASTQ
jgi:hypothetical protein